MLVTNGKYATHMAYNRNRERAKREILFRHKEEFHQVFDELLITDPEYQPQRNAPRNLYLRKLMFTKESRYVEQRDLG